jgi:DNA replication initiation complex subunit (GINS family)
MLKAEKIKKEIDVLPNDMLDEVEKFIKSLKQRKKNGKRKSALLYELAEIATNIDIPKDFSKQHDHYLYGMPKK